jgi:hypothetical protein
VCVCFSDWTRNSEGIASKAVISRDEEAAAELGKRRELIERAEEPNSARRVEGAA